MGKAAEFALQVIINISTILGIRVALTSVFSGGGEWGN